MIEDNGVGFDVKSMSENGEAHVSLTALEERVQQVGGEISIESQPDQGTTIHLTIPTPDTF
jgi:two-component system nitrate/nitrite sensor histidine kinase NarX